MINQSPSKRAPDLDGSTHNPSGSVRRKSATWGWIHTPSVPVGTSGGALSISVSVFLWLQLLLLCTVLLGGAHSLKEAQLRREKRPSEGGGRGEETPATNGI